MRMLTVPDEDGPFWSPHDLQFAEEDARPIVEAMLSQVADDKPFRFYKIGIDTRDLEDPGYWDTLSSDSASAIVLGDKLGLLLTNGTA